MTHQIEELSLKFDPPAQFLVTPGRVLLTEGFLQRQGRGLLGTIVDRWCFLFNDLFVISKPNKARTSFVRVYCFMLHLKLALSQAL
jgi:hypothetical protein